RGQPSSCRDEWTRPAWQACPPRRARPGPSSRSRRSTCARSLTRGGRFEYLLHLGKDRIDGTLGVDTYEYAFRAVVLDEGLGLLVEGLEAVPDDLRSVIRAPLLKSAHMEPLDGELVRHPEVEDGEE